MSATARRGPIVIDTDVFSADLVYGALRRGWGAARMLKLDAKIQRAEVVHIGPDLVHVHAHLHAACEAAAHALAQREHNADRWIAETANRLGVPLSASRRPATG